MSGSEPRDFLEMSALGGSRPCVRDIAVEMPCAVEVNGFGYSVMMVTPSDLEDFGYGFCLSERLIDGRDGMARVDLHRADDGTVLRITTEPSLRERVFDRVRHRVSESSCGICGIESLEQALRPLPRLPDRAESLAADSVFAALSAIRQHQPLNRLSGAVHAAAACEADGTIIQVREDVGRHNAFDKLIGAMLRSGQGWAGRFALLSSRCSYELIEKAALAGCDTIATISAATSLALNRAAEANIRLLSLARSDSFLIPEE